MFWNKYPYTDFHELNLDWILKLMMEMHKEWDEFTAVNKITNAGAWDITKQYQAWTVVSDNNIGYISLKPVPVGVAITNTEYWGVIADYNILITDLSNRISALEADNITNKANIATLKNNFPGKTENNPAKRKMLFVGDSYSLSDGSWSWPVWWEHIVSNLGITNYLSLEADGGGFADPANNHNPDYDGLTFGQILATYFTADNDVTDVVVAAGMNDYDETRTNIENGIDLFVSTARTLYPNAKIWISHIGWSTNYSIDDDIIEKSYTYYKYKAIKLGCTFIDANGCWGYADEFDDAIHPNSDGQYHIGLLLSSALCGSEFDRLDEKAISTTLQFGTGSVPLTLYQDGNDLFFRSESYQQLSLGGYTIPGNIWVKFLTLDSSTIPITPYQLFGYIPLRINATDNTIWFITASAVIENGDVYINIPAGMATTTLYVSPFEISGKFRGAKYY